LSDVSSFGDGGTPSSTKITPTRVISGLVEGRGGPTPTYIQHTFVIKCKSPSQISCCDVGGATNILLLDDGVKEL